MPRFSPAVLVLVLAVLPNVVTAAATPWAPTAAESFSTEAGTLVTWAPGTELADSYRVYGVTSSGATLLSTTPSLSAIVAPGYESYVVTGVKDGVESSGTTVMWPFCTYTSLDPPDVWVEPCHDDPPA